MLQPVHVLPCHSPSPVEQRRHSGKFENCEHPKKARVPTFVNFNGEDEEDGADGTDHGVDIPANVLYSVVGIPVAGEVHSFLEVEAAEPVDEAAEGIHEKGED